jgi:hypothetical protein
MRGHRNSGLAAMLIAGMALAVTPRPAAEMTDEERKTPAEPDLVYPPETKANLPGETNRQYAARLKLEAGQ